MTITPAEHQRRPPAIEPEQLAEWEFPLVRRGYDPDLVRVVLGRAAEELRARSAEPADADVEGVVVLRAQLEEAEAALAGAQARAAEADAVLAQVQAERSAELAAAATQAAQREGELAALGQEVAQLESTVRSLRAELGEALEARAQVEAELGRMHEQASGAAVPPSSDAWDRVAAEVASVLRGADQDAARLRSDADAHAAEVRRSAEHAAAELRADADRYAAELTAQTDAWATQRLAKADRELAIARGELEAAQAEAVAVREHARAEAEALAGAVAEHLRQRIEAVQAEVGERIARSERSWADLRQQLDVVAAQVERARGSVGASPVVALDLGDAFAMVEARSPAVADGMEPSRTGEEPGAVDG